MVDRDALSSRLDALESYLAELRSFRSRTREEFVREPALHHLAERLLHLACECVVDLAHHIISDLGLRQPSNYKDAMAVLAEAAAIPQELAERMKLWMGFRNVLVHFYLTVDHGRAYDAIVNELGDFEDFARAMSRYL
ncbi:MAG: DUF86 domain-containing protein [Acidobacteria bacterium]|nr:DUF86 domain-containing protein [Acidobacteriota bacterium]